MSPADSRTGQRPSRRYGRRPHFKTTTGCLLCRQRRVKCTEEKPTCKACDRRQVTCSYPEDQRQPRRSSSRATSLAAREAAIPRSSPPLEGALSSNPLGTSRSCTPAAPSDATVNTTCASETPQQESPQPPTSVAHTTASITAGLLASSVAQASDNESPSCRTVHTTSSTPHTSSTVSTTFGISDLELLHHWTVATSVDIYKSGPLDSLWQITIPQIGFKYPFVAHGILSLAALHLAYIEGTSNNSYIVAATRHHEEALEGFHEAIRNISEENSEALLVWSLLNIFYVFTISRQLGGRLEREQPRLRRDRVLGVEWIPMMRGVDAVLGPTYEFLRTGRMNSILNLGNWNEINPEAIPSEAMEVQMCRLRETWATGTEVETYDTALHILRKCRIYALQFKSMDSETMENWGFNRASASPLSFVHFAPKQYFTLLHQRQPPALMLFAYFGVLLHALDDSWFLEGWGKDIVEVVDDLLGSYWRPWIAWAIEHVDLR